jgi:hypothetical protein
VWEGVVAEATKPAHSRFGGRVAVKQPSEYRQYAAECLSFAEREDCPASREQFLERAETWEKLAAATAALLADHPSLTGESAPAARAADEGGAPLDPFVSRSSAAA